MSTVPVMVNVPSSTDPLPSTLSVQYAPLSVYGVPASRVIKLSPMSVITGAALSITLTVLVADPPFPSLSIFVYVRLYVHNLSVSTLPDRVKVELRLDPDPSRLSLHIAPLST